MRRWREFFACTMQFFVILFLMQLNIIKAQPVDQNNKDYLALIAIKAKITHDPQNAFRSWNESVHFCNWEGVICSRKHPRVTILDLQSKGLVGSLSPYIGNMSFLREIILQNNSLQGEIPQEIGNLFRLQALHLDNNSFVREIPSNLSYCSNLIVLTLSRNNLVGIIPEELATLSKLIQLSLHRNYLTGSLPSFLGNFSSLTSFSASANFLTGSIPESLGQLKYLSSLGLHGNNLSGIIPPAIYNISSIKTFLVSNNSLHGTIPSNIGLSLPHLQRLQLWGNHFIGSLTVSLSNASEITHIDIGENNFTGEVAIHFGGLQKLSHLNIYRTNIVDDLNFITSLLNCSNLVLLELSGNQFQGMFPSSIANISSPLQFLSIGLNRIYGGIPPWLSTLGSLSFLSMQFNQITGTVPEEIGKLQNLRRLNLDNNRLSGPIPSSIGNISSLSLLYLTNNKFHGTIPFSLGNCHNLLFMDISQNNLNGSISSQLFSVSSMLVSIDLSQNQLVGSLPSEIGNLFRLSELIVSQNKLSGTIPDGIGQCQSLEILRVDDNDFEGTIPTSFESLTGLRQLDLSSNNLSGEIPEYFGRFTLEYLNLSANNFEGEVPSIGTFRNSSVISVEGNNRLCGGIPELKLPRCINPATERNKPEVFKIVAISISCIVGVTLMSGFLYFRLRNKRTATSPNALIKPFRELSYNMILRATNVFSNETLIGVGSFGSVYKGTFDEDGEIVAIKVLNLQRRGASKSFMAECNALRNIRHRNLVKIITSCSSIDHQGNDFKALVYEYMANGNLENWLHPSSEMEIASVQLQQTSRLSLLQRINIAIDVGNALDYLHHQCEKSIIHCDLKPSNILLDNDMVAHVGDFGLAKILQLADPAQSSSLGVRGTVGYAAPEYGIGSEVSTSGDVYSYGILLLEMMTGKKPTNNIFTESNNIHNLCRMALPDRALEIADTTLLQVEEAREGNNDGPVEANDRIVESIIAMIKIGLECSMESPQDRVDISNALSDLRSIRNKYMRATTGRPRRFTNIARGR